MIDEMQQEMEQLSPEELEAIRPSAHHLLAQTMYIVVKTINRGRFAVGMLQKNFEALTDDEIMRALGGDTKGNFVLQTRFLCTLWRQIASIYNKEEYYEKYETCRDGYELIEMIRDMLPAPVSMIKEEYDNGVPLEDLLA